MLHSAASRLVVVSATLACALFVSARADAAVIAGDEGGKLDLVASFAIVPPIGSSYRDTADALGFDRFGWHTTYEGEVTALFHVPAIEGLTLGPLVRLSIHQLSGPYESVSPIDTDALWVGARAEYRLSRFPVIFGWTDVVAGLARIGPADDHAILGAVGGRAGIGLRVGYPCAALRFRVGYGYAPTLASVSDSAGRFNFGGFAIAIDGALRVLE